MKEEIDKTIEKEIEKITLEDKNNDIKNKANNSQKQKNSIDTGGNKKNTAFVIIGMAGAGKTTFCQRLYSWISQDSCEIDKTTGLNKNIYSINLDPAVVNPKMPLNVDIRDHVDHFDVMKNHRLGPNGATSTCLNIFLLNNRNLFNNTESEYIIVDTPGQIESFTWSSTGYVVIDTLRQNSNVIVIYLIDGVASQEPSVFMSNMIYSISLMSRYNVPVLCTFNKSDMGDFSKIESWIRDYEGFRSSLDDSKYNTPMLGSMALYFEEFYNEIDVVSVSSYTGEGKMMFFDKVRDILIEQNNTVKNQ